jgi:hypothetical protein
MVEPVIQYLCVIVLQFVTLHCHRRLVPVSLSARLNKMTRLPLLMLITLIKTFASKTLGALRQDPRRRRAQLSHVMEGYRGPGARRVLHGDLPGQMDQAGPAR